MKKSIVVFNEDVQAVSFIDPDLKIETIIGEKAALSEVLSEIGPTVPMRVEAETDSGNSVGLETVSQEDPRFLDALVANLRQKSFIAAVIPEGFKRLFVNLNQKDISSEEREDLVSRLVNMQDTEAEELLGDMKELESVLK